MYLTFKTFIEKNELFGTYHRLLVAFSAGIDSMVLVALLRRYGVDVGLAHCNFRLRGEASDADESFVRQWAEQYQIPCYVQGFNTLSHAKKRQISTQMAARELRYTWFNDLLEEHHFDYLLTAHHADDQAETVLFNLAKGTGIAGLCGIHIKRDRLIRPLLFASKRQITVYAQEQGIVWREDSSNSSDQYKRNLIRHQVVPALKKVNPKLEHTLIASTRRIRAAEQVFSMYIDRLKQKILSQQGERWLIFKNSFEPNIDRAVLLYEILKDFGFNLSQAEDLCNTARGETGRRIFSPKDYCCSDERDCYVVQAVKDQKNNETSTIQEWQAGLSMKNFFVAQRQYLKKEYTICKDKNIAACDFHSLVYPLRLRKWQPGDKFIPLGMRQHKKVSDFLKDEKIPTYQKKDIWLLIAKNQIVWVVGHRISDKFKITTDTKKVVEFSIN